MENLTTSATTRVAVIGSGGRAAGVIRKLKEAQPTIEIAGLCDPDSLALERAIDWIGLDASIIRSEEAILNDPTIDWVVIGSPNYLHAEHVVRAFAAGKNVFCEKPLATQCGDIPALVKAWRDSGREFVFGLVLRHSPVYRKVKEILASGTIGTIVSLEFNETLLPGHGGYIHGNWRRKRELAGTHLLEKCCHDIDLCLWFTESLPMRTASFGGLNFFVPKNQAAAEKLVDPKTGKSIYRTWPDIHGIDPFNTDKDIIDNQVAILEFASGCRATFHTNCNASINERRFYIVGTTGTIRADAITGMIEVKSTDPSSTMETIDAGVRGGHAGGDGQLVASFAQTISDGTPPPAGMKEGVCSLIAANGIDCAMDTGQVYDLSNDWKQYYHPYFDNRNSG